jgi:hypothetical protein
LYAATDSLSVTMAEIKNWIAEQLGIDKSDLQLAKDGARRSSKKISNKKLLTAGYRFKFPDYRSGYGQVIDCWKNNQ